MGYKYRLPAGYTPDATRSTKPNEAFTEAYSRFHRVWAEILREVLVELIDDLTVPPGPRGLAAAVLEGYDAGRAKWCPEALAKQTEA